MKQILDSITLTLNMDVLHRRARAKPGSEQAGELQQMARQALAVAHPRAAFRMAFIDRRGEDWVDIEAVRFSSRVLVVNLDEAQRVFACLATCGTELEQWAAGFSDLLLRYYADVIREMALRQAFDQLTAFLEQRFQLSATTYMSPGSLPDWPITEQAPLFRLMDGMDSAIGVRLSDSMLMWPIKSLSGLRFPRAETFVSCQLCPRQNCPNRRAPYQPELYDQKYRPAHEHNEL